MTVLRHALASSSLRGVALAFLLFNVAEWATWIAMLVYAFAVGGTTAAGLVALVQLIPASLVAPVAASLGDRLPRAQVLAWGYVVQASAMGATAVALFRDASLAVVYPLAALTVSSITVTRPVQAALLPSLAASPQELTAANVVSGAIVSLSVLAGPLLAAALLEVGAPDLVFATMSVLLVGAFLSVRGLPRLRTESPGRGAASRPVEDLREGIKDLVERPHSAAVVGVVTGQFLQIGALDVLIVALSLGLLGLGDSGAGLLNACFGLGGVLGAVATATLIGRRRLVPSLLTGVVAFGLSLVAIGIFPTRVLAPVLLALAGAGRALIDVAGRTLLQRIVPHALLARVFGLLEGLTMASLAVGSILVPGLVELVGVAATFIIVGALLPGLSALTYRPLAWADAASFVPSERIDLLKRIPMFAPLSGPVIERLASSLLPETTSEGDVIIREGDEGDRIFLIAGGEVEVSIDGRVVKRLGPDDFFGEIALLRNVPRTATVTSVRDDTELLSLQREPFLETITGHPQSRTAAENVAQERLSRDQFLLHWGEDHHNLQVEATVLLTQAQVLLYRGRTDEAAAIQERLIGLAREIEDLQVLVPALAVTALVERAQGRTSQAVALIDEIDHLTKEHHGWRARSMPTAVRVLISADEVDAAHELLSEMEAGAARDRHSLLTAKAIVTEATGGLEEARGLYSQAAQRWADYGFVLEEGHAFLGLARCLISLGDCDAATESLVRARALFANLDAGPLLDEVDLISAKATALNSQLG